MAHDVDARVPRWLRLRTDDWTNGTGDAVIARCGFAGYGRWIVTAQMLSRAEGATVDVGEEWQALSLSRKLGLDVEELRAFLDGLAESGAIDAELLADGKLFSSDVCEQQQAYMTKIENGAKGGRPRNALQGEIT